MGHCVNYYVVDKKSEIMPTAEEHAFINTDRQENRSGSYHGNMRISEDKVFPDRDSAEEYIDNLDGFYQDYAVRFHDITSLPHSKKAKQLEEKISELRAKKSEYIKAHSVKTHKSAQVGCKNCGSKLTIKYLGSEMCPVCGLDLRSDYILEQVRSYDQKVLDVEKTLKEERRKQHEKAPIKWLVKVDVHC